MLREIPSGGTAEESIVGWRSKSQRDSNTMWGRFTLRTPTEDIVKTFRLVDAHDLKSHYTIVPTLQLAAIKRKC